jgi:hypothetical protein
VESVKRGPCLCQQPASLRLAHHLAGGALTVKFIVALGGK